MRKTTTNQITPKVLAKMVGLSPQTIRKLTNRGILACERASNGYRYFPDPETAMEQINSRPNQRRLGSVKTEFHQQIVQLWNTTSWTQPEIAESLSVSTQYVRTIVSHSYPKAPPERVCAMCGKTFKPISYIAIYCSRLCNGRAHRARVKNTGSLGYRICPTCEEYFPVTHIKQKYCTRACFHSSDRPRYKYKPSSTERNTTIRELRKGGLLLREISKKTGLTVSSISRICSDDPAQQRGYYEMD